MHLMEVVQEMDPEDIILRPKSPEVGRVAPKRFSMANLESLVELRIRLDCWASGTW